MIDTSSVPKKATKIKKTDYSDEEAENSDGSAAGNGSENED